MSEVPDGFVRHERTSLPTAPWAPLWFRAADATLGVRIAALADNIMGIACALARPSHPVTVGLSVDYLGSVRIGQWIEFTPTVDKAGSTFGFATCRVTADGVLRARASATFAMGGK